MAIAIDQLNIGTPNVIDATATTIVLTMNQNVASNAFIVVAVGWFSATATLSTVANSGTDLGWTIAVQGKHPSDNVRAAIVYAQAPSGLASGTTITATYSATSPARCICGTSFTGVKTSSPVDVTGSPNATGNANWTTQSLSVAAGSLVYGTSHLNNQATSTITSPSIEIADFNAGAATTSMTAGYRIESSAGSVAVAGLWTAAEINMGLGAAFLEGVATEAPVLTKSFTAIPFMK